MGVVARLAEDRSAHVDALLPEGLPLVRVHRVVLRQVLINLLESAIESQVQTPIRVAARVVADKVRLEISAFRPNPTAAIQPSDVEARLSAVRSLVELQGGRLDVYQGENVVFHTAVTLPLTRSRTLLVIDDNPDIAFLFSRMLRERDYRVIQASTGLAAMQLAREAHPDAITLDVLMPSQDGWDLLRTLNSDPATQQIPVILCSVLPERSLALSLGVAAFLNKPVTREALLAALCHCIPCPQTG